MDISFVSFCGCSGATRRKTERRRYRERISRWFQLGAGTTKETNRTKTNLHALWTLVWSSFPGCKENDCFERADLDSVRTERGRNVRVAIMLPVACRPIAARYLAIALAQIALARIAQRWACAADGASGRHAAAAHRAAILDALRPWSGMPAPRIRKENGRALFQLCAALASAAATPPSSEEMAEAEELQGVISAAYELVGWNTYLPLAEECLAGLQ